LDRKEFLTLLGLGTGALLTGCLGGCNKDNDPQPVDFTLDLADPANAALNNPNGGYVYRNRVIVARTATGLFVAVQQHCTHEGVSLEFVGGSGVFHCPNHNAEFSTSGTVVRSPDVGSATNLKTYRVTRNGNILRVQE